MAGSSSGAAGPFDSRPDGMPVAEIALQMSEKKPCLRCERAIDPYAKICPYCNWDQSQTNPPPMQANEGGATYVPPAERNWRRLVMTVGGFILLLAVSFGVGAWINSDGAPKNAPEPVTTSAEQPAPAPTKRSGMTLVPVEPGDENEPPITSAPSAVVAEGQPAEYQRSDATAVSSVEYTQLAQRAIAEKKANVVDPRSIRGPAYTPAPARERMPVRSQTNPDSPASPQSPMTSASGDSPQVPTERARVVVSTRPVPQYQPVPEITVAEPVTARLELVVGADGRVKEVNLKNSIPGQTPKLIAAVQSWRFKPATENGVPVSAPFTVDISFGPR